MNAAGMNIGWTKECSVRILSQAHVTFGEIEVFAVVGLLAS
jgi:hypothetical protein